MEFAFTEEQKMIRDTAESFLAEVSTSEAIRSAMETELGYDPNLWNTLCNEMYWQAVTIPEQYGGLGLGYVELVALMEQMGRFLLCSPYFATVCLATNALLIGATEAQKDEYLAKICSGETATVAFSSIQSSQNGGCWTVDAVGVHGERVGDQLVLNGEARYVVDGCTAQTIIVAVKEPQGLSFAIVPGDAVGLDAQWLPTMDQTRKLAHLTFNNVKVDASHIMAHATRAEPILETLLALATVALAAEQTGGAQQTLDMSVEYAKERVQFNRTIASFQAIKHKAADMMTRVEVSRSGVYYAACVAQEALEAALRATEPELSEELAEAASVSKAYASDAYFKNAGEAIQIHGGVGFTWEYDVHLYFKRAKASEHYLGNGDYHREKLAALLLDKELAS